MKLRIPIASLVVVLLLTTIVQAQRSPKELLKQAKTICVTSPEGPSTDLKAEISNKLTQWGKLIVLTDCDKADLILKVELTRGFSEWKGKGAKGSVQVSDRQTNAVIWATNAGGDWVLSGWSSGKVGRRLADKFIDYYKKQTK